MLTSSKDEAVLIFEWAFWVSIFDDKHDHTSASVLNGGVGRDTLYFSLRRDQRRFSHDKTVHLGSLESSDEKKICLDI